MYLSNKICTELQFCSGTVSEIESVNCAQTVIITLLLLLSYIHEVMTLSIITTFTW